jgi:hypothetical protein
MEKTGAKKRASAAILVRDRTIVDQVTSSLSSRKQLLIIDKDKIQYNEVLIGMINFPLFTVYIAR